ncbi:GNAT family N-acetyltransferase [Subtercola boreus]|uniref:GNAT family N-acetyltransferase n=1 Tax=Subtercola boreus TaxID=120213 RepID=A0A3E0W9I7_9MICO|nr:GNAT family protein [Subtercola boreus]RFA18980.1 GNAT family N-acetyltransferase [Subtercola boreus]RFA19107.1 GNAT family N-acetyltransferase [Subtercola boreus]RFA25706.1 GNAT family N-acetyltransferase [Subtercola boreus]
MQHDIRLAGYGIRLEPVDTRYAAALQALTDDALWAGMTAPRPTDAAGYAAHIDTQVGTLGTLAFVVLGDDGEVRGTTSFYEYAPRQRRIEIGSTWYARAFWGGRTNPAAKRLLFGHAFDELGVARVALRCDARNTRSAAAIERLGAVPEGVLRSHRSSPDGSRGDTAYFSVLDTEWPTVRAGLDARLVAPPA